MQIMKFLTLFTTTLLMFSINVSAVKYKAITLEDFFGDEVNRSGQIVIVQGPLVNYKEEEDPFSDAKTVSSLVLQKSNQKITIILKEEIPIEKFEIGKIINIRFNVGAMMPNYHIGSKGELIEGPVELVKSKSKVTVKTEYSIDEYFDANIKIGGRKVKLHGVISDFGKSGADEVRIEFNSKKGNIQAYVDAQIWKSSEKMKSLFKKIKLGDEIGVIGSFMVEPTVFNVDDIYSPTGVSKKTKKIGSDYITIKKYFSDNKKYGNKLIKLYGPINKFSKTGSNEVLIEFSDKGEINAYIDQTIWKKSNKMKTLFKKMKSGTNIGIIGSFEMEGPLYIFTVKDLFE